MPSSTRLAALGAGLLLSTGLVALAPPAAAATPDGRSGPVIVAGAQWLVRTTPTGGAAQLTFNYGRSDDLPVVGDWDGNGSETVGRVRFTAAGTFQWLLRNSNSGGPADVTVSFGQIRFVAVDRLGSIPVVGNFDPADDAYEIGVARYDDTTGLITWQIRRDLTPTSPVSTFVYGRTATDVPVVGDWDGDGADTAGVVRSPNRWLLTDRVLAGGGATRSFAYGASDPRVTELPVPGDWDGNGTDTPAVLRNVPATRAEGPFQQWLYRNVNSAGPATGTFTYGGAAQTLSQPIEYAPRLAIEVT
jgi:hypothetical protein